MVEQSASLIPYAPRQIDGELVQTVEGKDIHDFLGVGKAYSTWVKTQINRLKLIENRDYVVYSPEGRNPQGGRPSTEYYFTFDAAKHIGMISGTDKGNEVREYFIAKEKELRALQEEENQHPLVRQARAIARIEARQAQMEQRIEAIESRRPPVGKMLIQDWIAQHGKQRLYGLLWEELKRDCRRREEPERFRPEGWEFPLPYYTPETIEAAYNHVTRQLTFLRDPGVKYQAKKKRKRGVS